MESLPIFVYGTLKQGEERADKWPHPPLRIESAVARAELYDLGPYPALTDGEQVVLGELWFVAPEHLAETIARLDRVECFGIDDVDLYERRVIEVRVHNGMVQRAYAYFIADPTSLRGHRRVLPDASGLCLWSRRRD